MKVTFPLREPVALEKALYRMFLVHSSVQVRALVVEILPPLELAL